MSTVVPVTHESIVREQPRLERAVKSVATRGLLECLIVSPRAQQRELLSRAATASGWASVVCGDAGTARDLAGRIVVKLAFIDLEQSPLDDLADLQDLAAELSRMGCPLLVVCGAEGNAAARNLGSPTRRLALSARHGRRRSDDRIVRRSPLGRRAIEVQTRPLSRPRSN